MRHIEEEQISAYIDNQLDAGETAALEAHMRDCAHCRAVLDEMKDVTCLFRDAERMDPSPFLWRRIAADLREAEAVRGDWGSILAAALRGHRRALGMAAAALTLFSAVGVTIFYRNARQIAQQAALASIDQTRRSMAAYDPDAYNPFSSGSLGDLDTNPFKLLRLGSRSAPGSEGK
jgi:anti-sigma factor RsiW